MSKAKPYVPYAGPLVSRAEAKGAGLPRYFTGKPCKHGHIAQRIAANGTCIVCSNATANAVHKANPEKQRVTRIAWRIANRELRNATERAARARNPELARLRSQRWEDAHPGYRRGFYVANTEAIKQRVKDWAAQNPEKARALGRAYRARSASADGSHTGAEIIALLERQKGKCAYCRVSLKKGYHADHIVALVQGGSNRISNIQLTCAKCNMRKNRTDPAKFARKMGLLI